MKYLKILLLSCTILALTGFSARSQALQKGDFLITGFSSYPNWGKFLVETTLEADGINQYDVNGIPPSGIKLEFMLSNEMSFTLDGIFNTWNASWIDNNDYENNVKLNRTRFQIGFNYHIPDMDSDDLDLYGGMAIGSNSRNISVTSDNPGFDVDSFVDNPFVAFPLSFRVRFGGTYYIKQNFGINFEVATGGPIVGAGLVFKIQK